MRWHHRGMTNEDADWVTIGGWNPRWAKVVFAAVHGSIALAMIDCGGDGRTFCLDVFVHDADGGWETTQGLQDIGLGDNAHRGLDFVLAYGRASPRSAVQIDYVGHRHVAITGAAGWWTFVHPRLDEESVPVRAT